MTGAMIVAGVINTRSVEQIPVTSDEGKQCTATVIENPMMVTGGLTLPRFSDGDSIIFMHDKSMLKHEAGHSAQICEEGGLIFAKNYLGDPLRYERDAQNRADRIAK